MVLEIKLSTYEMFGSCCRLLCAQEELQRLKTKNAQVGFTICIYDVHEHRILTKFLIHVETGVKFHSALVYALSQLHAQLKMK